MLNKKPTVFVITGPTASAKSAVAILLAKKINGEIISADSMQIYKGLDVGTAKATEKEQKEVKHHLIDVCDIKDTFSVADYKVMCYTKIEEIINKGKTAVIVGGTGLYINAVVNNMNFDSVEELKKKEKLNYIEMSEDKLFELLEVLDIKTAKSIDKKNKRKVIRAINMAHSNVKKSEVNLRSDLWQKNESNYNFFIFYIDMPRDILYDRINLRVDMMSKEKLLKEAKLLYNIKVKQERKKNQEKEESIVEHITALQAIGYKEFFKYFEGNETLDEALEILKKNTRHYAKRQITWFKKLDNKFLVDGTNSKDKIIENIIRGYNEK